MKRKTLTLVLCLLTVLSVVGVGFASWIITDGDKAIESGNIIVDTVSDQRLVLTVTQPTEMDINFTGPASPVNDGKWLKSNNPSATANLEVTFTCKVTKKDDSTFTAVSDIKLTKSFVEPALTQGDPATDTAYGAAKKANCFALADGTIDGLEYEDGIYVSDLALADGNKSITFTVTVKYVWGSIFGNDNPFTYYNDGKTAGGVCGQTVDGNSSATWGDHASYYLTLLSAIPADTAYSLTIQVDPAV